MTKFYGSQAYKDNDVHNFLPYGCQMYVDPGYTDYSRVVFNNVSACELEVPKEKCLEYAKWQYGNRVAATRDALVVGNWGHVPSGCSVQSSGDMAAHYNEKPNVGPKSEYTKVMHPNCEPTHNKPGECATDASACSWGTRSLSFRVFKTPGGYVVGDSPEDHDVVTPSSYVIKKTGTPALNVTKEECRAFSEHYCDGNKNCAGNSFIEYSNSGFRKAALRGATLHKKMRTGGTRSRGTSTMPTRATRATRTRTPLVASKKHELACAHRHFFHHSINKPMTKTTKRSVRLAQEGHQVTRGHNDASLDREACKKYALASGFKWQENNPSPADSVKGCYLVASNNNVLQPPRDRRSALQHDDEVHSRQEAGHVPLDGPIQRPVRPDRQVALW